MRGVFGLRRSLVAVFAAFAVAVPVYVVATALPAGAVDVNTAALLATNFNDPNVTSITMTADINIDCGHLLDRTSGNAITLDGGGHTLTQGCANSRVMTGAGAGGLTLTNVTITGGHTTFTDNGAGVLWDADVTVTNSHVTGNTAAGNGGGIYTGGALIATGSTFTSNSADNSGGGAFSESGVVAIDSIFTNNNAGGGVEGCDCSGGGFSTQGSAFVTRTTFLNNAAGDCSDCGASGGGFFSDGIATVTGSMFTSNRAGEECSSCSASGGGFLSRDDATITDSVFNLNSAGNCGNCGGEGGGFEADGNVSLTGSTLTQNFAGACTSCGGDGGGATMFDGTFTITNSVFTQNEVECDTCNATGGGAMVFGGAFVSGAFFNGNVADCDFGCAGQGGGIFVNGPSINKDVRGSHQFPVGEVASQADGFGALSVSHSAFVSNEATCESPECEAGGGAIVADNVSPVSIDHSTFSGNHTIGTGGAIIIRFGDVDATITNSTITENTAGSLGAIVSFGASSLTLVYDTIVANTIEPFSFPEGAGAQAAVDSANVHVDGDLVSVATVIALPQGGTNCSKANGGTQTSQGYNFADDLTCGFTNAATGDRQGAGLPPIALGPLSDNGGIGQTMLPLAGSPLLDVIPPSACRTGAAANVTDDERGVTRPQGPGCEIGAAEVEVAAPPVIQPTFTG